MMECVPIVGKEALEPVQQSHLIQTELMLRMSLEIVKDALDIPRYNTDIVLVSLGSRVIEMQERAQIDYPALLHSKPTSL